MLHKSVKSVLLVFWISGTIISFTGCSTIISALGTDGLSSSEKEQYVSLATEYIKTYYSDIINVDDLSYITVSTENLSSDLLVRVSFGYSDYPAMHILNVQATPFDDIDYTVHAIEAKEKLNSLITEVFGASSSLDTPDIAIFSTGDSDIVSSADSLLSSYDSFPFGVAVSTKKNKTSLLSEFENRLTEAGISQPYYVFFYDDITTMIRDFRYESSIKGTGKYNNWVFRADYSTPIVFLGEGSAYASTLTPKKSS